ncbi:MAG: phosphatidate cytidylyltransferase, partial [Methanoregula sp.]|nr:phosphatidate cytidylyltransferase [Methanoregula sp.]
GIRYGKRRIYNGKSWEGTLSWILVKVLVLVPFLTITGAAVVVVVAGLIELFSPVDDNLIIPVSVCILLTIFPVLI